MIVITTRQMVLFLPRKAALKLGILLINAMYPLIKGEKEKALNSLNTAFGKEKSSEELTEICRYFFQNLVKGLMEVLQFSRLNSGNLSKIVTFEGKYYIDEALKPGNGVIILTAHFGNWELLGASLALSGYKINFIVRPVRNHRLDELVTQNRESKGIKCISRGASIKSALKCLKRNELLGILADIDTKVDGVFVDFFGNPAFTPRGPASIALRTGAAVVPAFIVRQNDDTHRIIIQPALKLIKTGNQEKDIEANTEYFNKVIESFIRKYPEQWIWMHQRWKTKPEDVSN
ncbi:lipid A biosynthesis lauroyl acyltransferase [Candidatus Poribacteria bacterium]|nr:lipid A biosynthesis lauroyl acyltransferase [Candidatus Poribacteria bacterium]